MKQLEVQIMGQSYLLGCPEGGESKLLDAVERVDTAMCKIRDSGKVKARDRIAVLAALNLAFDLSDQSITHSNGVSDKSGVSVSDNSLKGHPSMRTLLDRLDAALGEDGRLI